jgi:hypothetical protein
MWRDGQGHGGAVKVVEGWLGQWKVTKDMKDWPGSWRVDQRCDGVARGIV